MFGRRTFLGRAVAAIGWLLGLIGLKKVQPVVGSTVTEDKPFSGTLWTFGRKPKDQLSLLFTDGHLPAAAFIELLHTVNETAWMKYPAGTLQCVGFTIRKIDQCESDEIKRLFPNLADGFAAKWSRHLVTVEFSPVKSTLTGRYSTANFSRLTGGSA